MYHQSTRATNASAAKVTAWSGAKHSSVLKADYIREIMHIALLGSSFHPSSLGLNVALPDMPSL